MPYIGQGLQQGRRQLHTFTATASQTTFSVAYSPGYVDVYQNGILLAPSDFTATNGTTVVLAVGAAVNDEITIIAQHLFSVADVVSASQGGTFAGDVTMTGNLTVQGTTITVDTSTAQTLAMGDADKIILGDDNDLQMYHSGTTAYIDNNTGALYIRNNVDDDDGGNIIIEAKSGKASIVAQDDEGVRLYYNDVEKLETTNTGVTVTGTVVSNGITSNDDIVITPSGTGSVVLPAITINDNNITGTRTNENINITPAGTGTVVVNKLTIDSQIVIEDNEISTSQTNSDLIITPAGTGQVVMAKVDINGGAIDGTTVGASSATTGVFTTLTANTSATVDGITLSDNEISTNETNANLELSGNGSGGVSISGFTFPSSDGSSGQFLKTNGAGVLSFATAGVTLNHSAIADGTTTVSTSTTSNIDTFSASSFRSAKYVVSAANTEDSRFEIFEANITHDGTNAYVSTFGSTTSGTEPLGTFSADISGGNVRFRVTSITDDDVVYKFQRIALNA